MSLWLINAALALLVLLLLLRPLVTKPAKVSGRHGHRHLLASRLAEVEREHSVGLIDSDQHERARRETRESYGIRDDAPPREETSPATAKTVGVVVLFVLGAAGFYFKYSDGHQMLALERQARQIINEVNSVTVILQDYLRENPQDTESRLRLAETYYLVGNYSGAVAEYRRVEELDMLREDEQWLNYADAMLRAGEVEQTDAAVKTLDEMLGVSPDRRRVLFTLAFLHFEREEYTQAIGLWQRLLELLPADESAGVDAHLRDFITQAENRLAEEKNRNGAANGNTITVTVSLAPALRPAVAADDTVFVYARAIGGPSMPVAIKRLTAAELPAKVTLGDGDAMLANMSLGRFKQVEIVARVSKSGQALPAKGDLVGTASPVSVGESTLVEIGEVMN